MGGCFLSFEEIAKQSKAKIDGLLQDFLRKETVFGAGFHSLVKEFAEDMSEFNTRGGKRVRPLIAVQSYKLFHEKVPEDMWKAALAIELAEGFLLMHDDITDQAVLRRGKPTMHRIYEKKFNGLTSVNDAGEAKRFGDTVAMLGGDWLALIMLKIINEADFPAELKSRATIKFVDDINTVVFGQLLDVIYGYKPFSKVSEADVLQVFEMKTSAYTVSAPMHLGAILAGASEEDLRVLDAYCLPLGKAFQVTDDVLGTFGSEEKTGKPTDSDLKEGKRTILTLHAMKKGSEEQKKILMKVLNNSNATKEAVDAARKVLIDTGAVDYSKKLAKQFKDMAVQAIKKTKYNEDAKQFLIGMAEFVVAREH